MYHLVMGLVHSYFVKDLSSEEFIAGFPQALVIMENLEHHKKVTCMKKSWNLKKPELSWKIMEFCEII